MLVVLSSIEVYLDPLAKLNKRKSFTSKILVVVRLRFALQHSTKGSRVLVCSNSSFSAKVIKDVKLKVKDVVEVLVNLSLLLYSLLRSVRARILGSCAFAGRGRGERVAS
jgi:hypothetical protein